MQRSPESFTAIIDALGGHASAGLLLGIPPGTASAMKSRDSIAPRYWPRLIKVCAIHDVAGVTYETLARIYAARRARPSLEEVA